MIDLTKLTKSDIGRPVVYRPIVGMREDGTISSWNDTYVFVLYRGDSTPKATNPLDLDWLQQ